MLSNNLNISTLLVIAGFRMLFLFVTLLTNSGLPSTIDHGSPLLLLRRPINRSIPLASPGSMCIKSKPHNIVGKWYTPKVSPIQNGSREAVPPRSKWTNGSLGAVIKMRSPY